MEPLPPKSLKNEAVLSVFQNNGSKIVSSSPMPAVLIMTACKRDLFGILMCFTVFYIKISLLHKTISKASMYRKILPIFRLAFQAMIYVSHFEERKRDDQINSRYMIFCLLEV